MGRTPKNSAAGASARDGLPDPVIILGSPRSYSSLVCAMLGQHPETYGFPELNLFCGDTLQDVVEGFTGYRQVQLHGLLRTVAHLYSGEQSIAAIDMAHRWILLRLERRVEEVFAELQRKVAPRHVVDKSPLYSSSEQNLMRLRSRLPNAYYLHLTRHPRSQGESMMNVADGLMAIMANSIDYQAKPPVVDPQISWLEIQKNIVSFLEAVPETRRLQLRGEDVVTDPDSHLRQICAWLGIDQSEPSLRRMLQPEKSPFARLGPFGAHLGNDIGFLRSPALRKGKPHMPSLHDKLPWRPDGAGFSPAVVSMAQQLGYT